MSSPKLHFDTHAVNNISAKATSMETLALLSLLQKNVWQVWVGKCSIDQDSDLLLTVPTLYQSSL
jgi:hypothetical protein